MRKTCRTYLLGLAVLLAFFSTTPTHAQNAGQNWGAGVMLGEPTGLNLKVWASRSTAFVGGAAWSFRREGKLHLHLDYIFHKFRLIRAKPGKLPLYYGIGGRIKFEDDTRVGVRFPIGICYLFRNQPLDIFFEFVPILDLAPETEFDFNIAIGARFFFD